MRMPCDDPVYAVSCRTASGQFICAPLAYAAVPSRSAKAASSISLFSATAIESDGRWSSQVLSSSWLAVPGRISRSSAASRMAARSFASMLPSAQATRARGNNIMARTV